MLSIGISLNHKCRILAPMVTLYTHLNLARKLLYFIKTGMKDTPPPPDNGIAFRAHHCSRCGACVARMDHHCIYAANCVGAGNQKQFLLLLLYSTTSAAYANFLYFGTGALHCHSSTGNREANLADSAVASLSKGFGEALLAFGRCATWLGAALVLLFCWLTALLGVQLYGVVVDAGTIDRMQRFAISKSRGTELVTPWKAANQPEGVEPRKREGRKMAEGMPASLRSSNASPGPASVDVVIETGVGRIPHAAVSGAYSHSNEPTELSSSAMDGSRMDAIGGNHGFPSRDGNGAFAARDGEDAGHPATNSAGGRNSSRWRAFRQEVLGEGPWWMWFIPLPAKHDPDVEKRVYKP